MPTDLNTFDTTPHYAADDDDGRSLLALIAGLVAALIGGGIWAALVLVTNFEIGWVAWGIGGLVGVAMARTTANRTKQLAVAAAGFAVLGLLAGKVFIFLGSSGMIADAIEADAASLQGAVAWQMYDARELDDATLAEVDAAHQAGDTLSNATWAAMTSQAQSRLDAMSEDERHELALSAAQGVMGAIGLKAGVTAQLSFFDLLWVFLAVGTAFRMMSEPRRMPAAV